MALSDAWPGRDVGWLKVHGTVPGGPVEWLACAAAWAAAAPTAVTTGMSAATSVTANRAMTFALMFLRNEILGFQDI